MSVTVCVVCMMHTYVYGDGVMVSVPCTGAYRVCMHACRQWVLPHTQPSNHDPSQTTHT